MEKSGYVNVDELQAQTPLEEAAARCGVVLEIRGQGKEVRMDCPFGCDGDHCGRKELAINVENPQKVFMCHAYSCKFRGNLLTLMHGWLTGAKPMGNKLAGAEFQRVKSVLANRHPAERQASPVAKSRETQESPPPQPIRNVPLIDSLEEKVRELHNIDEKFIVDGGERHPHRV